MIGKEPGSLAELQFKVSYRSGRDDIIADFYTPSLRVAAEYRRAVGYFTSSGLASAARGVASLVARGGKMRLIASPYLQDTPEQNGLCERFIRILKEQCIWLHRFTSLLHARSVISHWVIQYNAIRPHKALNYLSPTK